MDPQSCSLSTVERKDTMSKRRLSDLSSKEPLPSDNKTPLPSHTNPSRLPEEKGIRRDRELLGDLKRIFGDLEYTVEQSSDHVFEVNLRVPHKMNNEDFFKREHLRTKLKAKMTRMRDARRRKSARR
eukprot:1371760-Amorphochlora_amoeboformis.AAC.2